MSLLGSHDSKILFLFFIIFVRLWSLFFFLTLFPFISVGFHYLYGSCVDSLSYIFFGLLASLLPFLSIVIFQSTVSHQLTQGDSSCTALPGVRILHCHYYITLLFLSCPVSSLTFAQHFCLCPVLYLAFRRCLFYYLFSLLLLLSYTTRHDLFTLSPNQQLLFGSDHSTINPSMYIVFLLLPTSGIT
jgi:hypothetical protein